MIWAQGGFSAIQETSPYIQSKDDTDTMAFPFPRPLDDFSPPFEPFATSDLCKRQGDLGRRVAVTG